MVGQLIIKHENNIDSKGERKMIEKKVIPINDMEFLCRIAGSDNDGASVVFLHGFPESSIIWERTMEKMAGLGYRCIAPDQRGYSDGARPEGYENYAFRPLTEDVLAFADYIGGGKQFHLVGHDIGAALGWNVVAMHPEKIKSWTALSVPYWPAYKWAMANDPVQKEKGSYVGHFMQPDVPEAFLAEDDYAILRKLWTGFRPEAIEDYMRIFSQPKARTAVINWYRGIMMVDENITYGNIDTPTAFIWGNKDLAIGKAGIEQSHKYMDGYYNFYELDAGHWLTEFNEPEVSEIIMNHIVNSTM
jgi:Predicted hydrolases or acyltransferases (alpha/beta hydrolase superfamily)